MIDTEKLLLELDDIKNDIEERLIRIENSTLLYMGNKNLDKSKEIAKLEVINKAIDIASRLDVEILN